MIAHTELTARSVTPERLSCLLCIAVWFALGAGLVEVAAQVVRRLVLQQFIHVGPHVVWLAPFVNLCLFIGVGLALLLVARRWPSVGSVRVLTWTWAFLAYAGVLLLFTPRLHKYAALCLAAGLAVQTSRLVVAHADGLYRLVRRTVGWMGGVVVVLMLGVSGWPMVTERRALAQLPRAPLHAPNVLLIVLDTVRAKSLSLHGYHRPTTPQLERFAQTGVLFEQAFSTSPWTLPSHASMFTGRFAHELSTNWLSPLDATYPTLAEVFSAHGYRTAGFVANLLYCTYETGLNRGFVHYEDHHISPGEVLRSASLGRFIASNSKLRDLIGYFDVPGRKSVAQVNRAFLDWLVDQEQRPFFAFLNYFDAHSPYLPPKPFNEKFGSSIVYRNTFLAGGGTVSTENAKKSGPALQAALDAYEGAIAYIDYQLGLLFNELRQRQLLQNTLIIITSDHGEQFGEHGLLSHSTSLYIPLLHVPLLMAFPTRMPAGMRVHTPVTLRDLPATIMSLLQLEGGAHFPGSSFQRYWHDAPPANGGEPTPVLSEVRRGIRTAPELPVSRGDMMSLVADSYHYIKNGDGQEEIYNIARDPLEEHDLASSAKERQLLENLRRSLEVGLTRP